MKLPAHSALSLILFCSFTFLGGCGKKGTNEDPFVLGTPPPVAYLGVEYEYNFGGAGGDRPLNFSLGAAPDWLSLEYVNNTARQGVVGRGIPGITGGRQGAADLGKSTGVQITVNDGNRFGSNTFDIEVKDNILKLVDQTITEGTASDLSGEVANSGNTQSNCDLPDVKTTGYYKEGSSVYPTHPVVIPITLAHPSVEKVRVRYKFVSDYSSSIGSGSSLRTLDQNSLENEHDANALTGTEDYVTRSSIDPSGDMSQLKPVPIYLEPSANGGVVTFEPGVTRCYIVADIVDDIRAEANETFRVELDKVIQGLASFTSQGSKATATITIKDNEPKVSFVEKGGILNEGTIRHYHIKLDRTVNRKITVHLISSPNLSTLTGSAVGSSATLTKDDFSITDSLYNTATQTRSYSKSTPSDDPGNTTQSDPATVGTVEFAPNTDTADFYLRIEKNNDGNITTDEDFALGFKREVTDSSARTPDSSNRSLANGDLLNLSINKWLDPAVFPAAVDFSANAFVVDSNHNVIVGETRSGTAYGKGKTMGYLEMFNLAGVKMGCFATTDSTNLSCTGNNTDNMLGSSGATDNTTILAMAFNKGTKVVGSGDKAKKVGLNNVVVVGTTTGALDSTRTTNDKDIFVASYDMSENSFSPSDPYILQWVKQLGSSSDDIPTSVVVDKSGNIYVAGTTSDTLPDGTQQATKDSKGNPITPVVEVNSKVGGKDAFVVAFDKDGKHLWSRNFGTTEDDQAVQMTIENGSSIFVTGTTAGAFDGKTNAGGLDVFRTKLTASGSVESTFQFGSANDDHVVGAENVNSNVIVGGDTSGSLALKDVSGKKAIDLSASSLTSQDLFMLKTDSVGNFNDVYQFGGSGTETATAIAGDTTYAYLAGVTDTELVSGSGVQGKDFVITAVNPGSATSLSAAWQIQKSIVGDQKVLRMDAGDEGKLYVLFSNDDLSGSGKSYSLNLFDESNGSDLNNQLSDTNIPNF
jgi:hypothetical protein